MCALVSGHCFTYKVSIPSRGIEGFYCRLCLLVGLA